MPRPQPHAAIALEPILSGLMAALTPGPLAPAGRAAKALLGLSMGLSAGETLMAEALGVLVLIDRHVAPVPGLRDLVEASLREAPRLAPPTLALLLADCLKNMSPADLEKVWAMVSGGPEAMLKEQGIGDLGSGIREWNAFLWGSVDRRPFP